MDEDFFYFLMEYAEKGTLEELLKGVGKIDVETCRWFLGEIVIALECLHKNSYVHRDLKPANLLLTNDYHIRLCDFGEAK